jgi:all-trans-retinol 13,14-reductase
LAKVIGANNMLYAGTENTPFFVHAAVVHSYLQSAYRCVDGSSQIAKYMVDGIKALGGTVLNYHEVIAFDISNDEAKSVTMADGKQMSAKWFISAIDFKKTMQIIDESHFRKVYRNRILNLPNTAAIFLLSVVMKEQSWKRMDYNVYHYIDHDIWNSASHTEKDWPRVIGAFPTYTSKDPEYTENMVMMAYMRYDEVAKWHDSFATIPHHKVSRGDDYEKFKHEKAVKLLGLFEDRLPGINAAVKSFTSATPLTYRDYIGSTDGTAYGFQKDYRVPMSSFFTSRTKVKNLLLTGQDLNLHGLLGVTISAVATTSEIFGHPYVINKIKESI